MSVINLKKENQRKRLTTLIKKLFPEFGYVKVKKSGEIILKRKWYSLKRRVTTALELCLAEIPERLSKHGYPNHLEKRRKYLSRIAYIVEVQDGSLIDYLFKELLKVPSLCSPSGESSLVELSSRSQSYSYFTTNYCTRLALKEAKTIKALQQKVLL